MSATLFYGLLAPLALQRFQGWKQKEGAVMAAVGIVLLVGFSRIV